MPPVVLLHLRLGLVYRSFFIVRPDDLLVLVLIELGAVSQGAILLAAGVVACVKVRLPVRFAHLAATAGRACMGSIPAGWCGRKAPVGGL